MQFDHEGYEWHETTTQEDVVVGRRVFIKGRSLNRVTELLGGIRGLIAETSALEGSLVSRDRVLEKLRSLL